MNSPATSTYLPPLEVNHEREGVGQELQTTLHELVDLSLIGKQLHWAVVGRSFGLFTSSWTSSSTPGASFPTPSPSGTSLSDSSPTGRRRRSRPGLSSPPSPLPPSRITWSCAS